MKKDIIIIKRGIQHMGDIMALIAWNVWKINVVGTIQSNGTGVPLRVSLKTNTMKKMYKYRM